jgi:uncharacterized protein YbjT (DUF2867 family)
MASMTQNNKIATVFGGTGFVGRQIVRELAARGVTIKVATRIPEKAYFLKPCGVVGQVVPVQCNYSSAESIAEAVKGADFVVNCIGILFEKGKGAGTFKVAHIETPAMIAKACKDARVKKMVHISALGCDTATSEYGKTKLEGEREVLAHFPKATILRPSVVFGEGDNFFNMFAELARYLPVLPLIGGGKTKMQPIYVGDVADAAVEAVLSEKAGAHVSYESKIYQLGGPEVLDFRAIYERLFKYTNRPRMLMSLPFGLAKVEATFLSILPKPLLTCDQVESLKTDSIVTAGALGIDKFGIAPKALDIILPRYLETFKSGGRFAKI